MIYWTQSIFGQERRVPTLTKIVVTFSTKALPKVHKVPDTRVYFRGVDDPTRGKVVSFVERRRRRKAPELVRRDSAHGAAARRRRGRELLHEPPEGARERTRRRAPTVLDYLEEDRDKMWVPVSLSLYPVWTRSVLWKLQETRPFNPSQSSKSVSLESESL